jgi:class 3 adenylate cyclase
VTFFFSDIQGSTRLVESLGSQYPEVLSRHRALVRDAFAAGRGLEVGTEGDSFFAVFDEAADAVDAAIAAQLALVGEPWPSGAPVRIRIGLHTGQALRDGDDYIGLDVHRAARIMAAAHGGQIVVSEATRLALGQPAGGIELRELGQHRLRDLSMPERLYQVSAEGLASASHRSGRSSPSRTTSPPRRPTSSIARPSSS